MAIASTHADVLVLQIYGTIYIETKSINVVFVGITKGAFKYGVYLLLLTDSHLLCGTFSRHFKQSSTVD